MLVAGRSYGSFFFSITCIGVGRVVFVEADQVASRLVDVYFVQREPEAVHVKHALLVPLGRRNAAAVSEHGVGAALVLTFRHLPGPAGRDRHRIISRKVVCHQARSIDVVLRSTW